MKALFEGVKHHRIKDEWETPRSVFDPLDEEFHFTLDPCALPDTAKCESYFTPDDDGLAQPWAPHRVFMNPPYGQLPQWVAKAYRESLRGALIVCLLPAATSSEWWHRYCMKGEIRFVRGRVRFVGAPSSAPFSNVIVIFRPLTQGGKR